MLASLSTSNYAPSAPMCDDPVAPTSPPNCSQDHLDLPQVRGERVRAVLNQPDAQKMRQLSQFSRDARAYFIYLEIKGKYLDLQRVVFVDQNQTPTFVTVAQNARGFLLWQRGPGMMTSKVALGWIVRNFMSQISGDNSGTFYVELTDTLGRRFRSALLDASWTTNNVSQVQGVTENFSY